MAAPLWGAQHQERLAAAAATQLQRILVGLHKAYKDAQHTQAKLTEQAAAIGPPRERAARDFRKQTLMTVRTLLLENALTSFMAMLLGHLKLKVRRECPGRILFARSGARMETDAYGISWVNTTGLSVAYQRLLTAVIDGLCAMDLRSQGKPMRVRLKELPP